MSEFFEMGGYAVYVWPSYALFVGILAALLIIPLRRRRRLIQDIRQSYQRQSLRRERTGDPQ